MDRSTRRRPSGREQTSHDQLIALDTRGVAPGGYGPAQAADEVTERSTSSGPFPTLPRRPAVRGGVHADPHVWRAHAHPDYIGTPGHDFLLAPGLYPGKNASASWMVDTRQDPVREFPALPERPGWQLLEDIYVPNFKAKGIETAWTTQPGTKDSRQSSPKSPPVSRFLSRATRLHLYDMSAGDGDGPSDEVLLVRGSLGPGSKQGPLTVPIWSNVPRLRGSRREDPRSPIRRPTMTSTADSRTTMPALLRPATTTLSGGP